MKKLLLLLTLFLGVLSVQAAPEYGTVIVSRVISVYDGDTFRVDIDSLPPIVGKNIPIRLNGVDTPEIRGKCKYEKDLAVGILKHDKQFYEKLPKTDFDSRQYDCGMLHSYDSFKCEDSNKEKFIDITTI